MSINAEDAEERRDPQRGEAPQMWNLDELHSKTQNAFEQLAAAVVVSKPDKEMTATATAKCHSCTIVVIVCVP